MTSCFFAKITKKNIFVNDWQLNHFLYPMDSSSGRSLFFFYRERQCKSAWSTSKWKNPLPIDHLFNDGRFDDLPQSCFLKQEVFKLVKSTLKNDETLCVVSVSVTTLSA